MTRTQPHEYAGDSVMLRTMQGIINVWNRAAQELYGWTEEDAVGRVSHDLLQTRFPKPLKEIESELVEKGRWEGKLVHTTRDGGRVAVQSRWVLDPTGQPGAVIEINAPSSDYELGAEGHADSDSVESGRQESLPGGELSKANGLLPKLADVVLAVNGAICVVVFVYVVYRFGWIGSKHFTNPTDILLYYLYYVVPAVLALLLFFSLRLRPAFRIKLALVLFSTAAAIYTAEILTTLIDVWLSLPSVSAQGDINERVRLAKRAGINFDVRSRLEVFRDLRKEGVDAYPAIAPYTLLKPTPTATEAQSGTKSKIIIDGSEVLPLSGISHKVSVLCNESGDYTIYDSDEHGFHNPKSLWNKGRIEIAALGDSFTHGYCVSSDKNFVALIRNAYPATLNLGMLGDGPLLMLATLQEYLQPMKPKVVLWFYFEGNDLRDLRIERNNALLMRYVTDDGFRQGLLYRQAEIDEALIAYVNTIQDEKPEQLRGFVERLTGASELPNRSREILRLSHLRQRLGLVLERGHKPKLASEYSDILETFTKVLARADESVSGWGGKLYFVYLPEWEPFGKPLNVDGRRKLVLEMVQTLGIPVIDIHPAFQAQKDPLALFPFRIDGHYNEAGHSIVAETVLKSVSLQN